MAFDEARADRAVQFFERLLTHTKGKWAGVPFILEEWQKNDIIRPLFGNVNGDGSRQFRRAYIEVPRKNGKSEIAAGIALKLLFDDGERGGEVYGAAGDRDQATIVFNVAAQMVRNSPILSKRARIIDSTKRIIDLKTDSFYRAIPAEAYSAHGFNASGIIFDELHVQPNRDLWDVLTTSTGARVQPLTFAITTAGYDRNSICWEQHERALKIKSGVLQDPSYFAYVRSAPDGANWRDESVWADCNPALGRFRSLEEMRDSAREADQVPARQNVFRRLYLNQWTSQEERWLDLAAWDASAGITLDRGVLEKALQGRRCYGGLNLVSTTDVAALVLVFPPKDPEGSYQVLPYFWLPAGNLHDRGRRDHVDYQAWSEQGLIELTEGNVIHYGAIKNKIKELSDRFQLEELAVDKNGATQMLQDLDELGQTVIPFGQGFKDLSPPTKELLNLVLSRRLQHAGHPVLRWMADNLMVRQNPEGDVRPDRARSSEKIDGMIALIMGLDRALRHLSMRSRYEDDTVLVL